MATLTVDTLDDVVNPTDGKTSLREAIALANDDDTITFASTLSGGTIYLTAEIGRDFPKFTIDGDLDGNGTPDITISGDAGRNDVTVGTTTITDLAATNAAGSGLADNVRIFEFHGPQPPGTPSQVTLNGVILTGGSDGSAGGAIQANRTDLIITNSVLSGNQTADRGGAIASTNNVFIDNSTISGNSAGELGGGFSAFTAQVNNSVVSDNTGGVGGIFVTGHLVLDKSTVSGNIGELTGGIWAAGAVITSVTLIDSTVSDNHATGSFGTGGGILTSDLIATNSTISNNSSGRIGGGFRAVDATLTNTTVSGNTSGEGGGIDAITAKLVNSTVTGNVATVAGGGIMVKDFSTSVSSLTLINSIVLGNDAPSESEISGTIIKSGGNIVGTDVFQGATDVGDTTAAEVFAATVDIGGGVLAGVLADNGGPVKTVALRTSAVNPAIDGGDDTLDAATDARGLARVDFQGVAHNGTNISDLGAYESQGEAPSLVVTTLSDVVNVFDGETSLREAILFANGKPGTDTITFATGLSGTIRLASSLPTNTETLIIDGDIDNDGAADITISGDVGGNDTITADGLTDIFNTAAANLADNMRILSATADLTLDGLVLTGGVAAAGDGGAVNGTTVTLTNATVSGNKAGAGFGGGIFASSDVTMTGSTVSGNTATFGGGVTANGTVTLTDSTVIGNHADQDAGGIGSGVATTLTNSTVSGNSADRNGGGVFSNGAVTLTNSTVSGNDAVTDGGGIIAFGAATFTNATVSGNTAGRNVGGVFAIGDLILTNSIVLGNDAAGGFDDFVANINGTTTWFGGNILGTDVYQGNAIVGSTSAAEVFAAIDPVTGGGLLADNGGPVQTIALRNSSFNPALDASNASAPPTDARGTARLDLPGVANVNGNAADLGAYELENTAPVVTPSGGTTAALEQIAIAVDAALVLADDSATLVSATVAITGGFVAGQDALAFAGNAGTGDIAGAYDAATGVLTLTSAGGATVAQLQAALRAVTYTNTSDTPSTANRTVSFTVDDGLALPNLAATKTVSVAALNDAPSGADKTVTTLEDTARVLAAADFGFSDVEGHAFVAVVITTIPASGVLRNGSTVLAAGAVVSVADIAAGNLAYTPPLNANGTGFASFTFQVRDNGGTASGGVDTDASPNRITFNVTPVNDAPTAVAIAATRTSIAENASTAARVKVGNITVTDVDGGANTLALTGPDAAFFQIVGTELFLKAGTKLDFETKTSYRVAVTVDDRSVGASPDAVSGTLTLAVTNVNEAPSIRLTNTVTTLAENVSTASARKVADIVVTDDALGSEVLSLTGADAKLFEIVGTTLRLKAGAKIDFETNPKLDVTVNVDDKAIGSGIDAKASLSIKVTDIVEIVRGAAGKDILKGSATTEVINGFAGDDTISGGGGHDTIIGGAGTDILTGGAGRDVFVFNSIADSGNGYSGFVSNGTLNALSGQGRRDVITDFTPGTDRINLSAIDADTSKSGNQAFQFHGTQAFARATADLVYKVYNPAGTANDKTIIYGDVNGDGKADFQIELTGLKTLTAGDFIL